MREGLELGKIEIYLRNWGKYSMIGGVKRIRKRKLDEVEEFRFRKERV